MRGVGGRKARGKLRTGNCFSLVDCYRLAIVFDHLMELTHKDFFSHDWLAVVQIHGFCILFPFPPPLLLRARICTHTYTMKTVSHPPGAEILTHMTVPLLSMCNFAGIALVWLHFFTIFLHTKKLRENCWFVEICPAPQNRNTHSHIHTWRHKVNRFFPRFVCCWFIHQDHHPTKDFFSGSRQSIDAFSTHRQDPIYPAL
uniref:(northern house mosquito) hypothetical protein n=1 Tax=Culex pipiens TaxID=7175 RepID=A0A8D8AJC4_CULPI